MKPFFSNYYADTAGLVPTDLYPIQYGESQCENGHCFGPCIRNNYIIHYVYSGYGRFKTEQDQYHLQKGQLFLICPDQLTYYSADPQQPWLYRWIEFNGSLVPALLKSAGLTSSSPILTDTENTPAGNALMDMIQNDTLCFERLMEKLWAFIFALTKGVKNLSLNQAEEYIRKAESFIKANLHKKITVSNVAAHIGIDRCYLSRLFQEYKKISPQQFIISLKLNAAIQYLKNTNITISEAAQSVGYPDAHVFTKAFKNQFKITPTQWRQQILWEQSIKEYKEP